MTALNKSKEDSSLLTFPRFRREPLPEKYENGKRIMMDLPVHPPNPTFCKRQAHLDDLQKIIASHYFHCKSLTFPNNPGHLQRKCTGPLYLKDVHLDYQDQLSRKIVVPDTFIYESVAISDYMVELNLEAKRKPKITLMPEF